MPNKNHLALVEFVLETAPSAPVARRVAVYRGLADLIGSAEEAKALNALADELEKAERKSQQFVFTFQQKNN